MSQLVAWLSQLVAWLNDPKNNRVILFIILILAFMPRLAAAFVLPIDYRLAASDAPEYIAGARNLITLGIFGEEPGVPYATIPPIYPLFIASVFAFTNQSLMAVRIAQVILAVLIVWLTYLIGKEVFSLQVGLLAAFISALYPVWIIRPALFMTEPLYTVLFLVFVWCFIRSLRNYSVKYTIWAGVTFALGLLTREIFFVFLLLLPLIVWWSGMSWRYAWRYVLLFTAALFLTISPWLIRNYFTFGQAFYTERTEAIRYRLTGQGYLAPRYQHLADSSIKPPQKTHLEFGHNERFGTSQQILNPDFALSNSEEYAQFIANRFIEIWLHPVGLYSLPDHILIRGLYITIHFIMMGLAVMGLVSGLKKRNLGVGVTVWLLLYTTGVLVLFMAPRPRYSLPFLPPIFILAVIGLTSLQTYVIKSRTQKWLENPR